MSHHVVDDDVCVQIWPVTPPDVHEMVSSVAEYSGGEQIFYIYTTRNLDHSSITLSQDSSLPLRA